MCFRDVMVDEIVNKSLLVGDEFMLKMHLGQPEFTYIACRPFTKNQKRIQTFKETGDWIYIYQNELDIACFQHFIAYEDVKDMSIHNIQNPKYDRYQCGFASVGAIKSEIMFSI